LAKNLTKKQEVFIAEYLVHLNATKAAIAAGYSKRTAEAAGSRLLRNVKVAAEIAKQKSARCEKLEITADYVVQNIRDIAEQCKRDGNVNGALRGFELLGKYKGVFTDNVNNNHRVTLEKLICASYDPALSRGDDEE
jgi:phage terminase small subunit